MDVAPDSQDGPQREQGLAQKYSNQGKITTLMLRNIPSKYTQDMLLEELIDCMGSSDSFDFFYLPWDQQNNCNIGYAFVNFRTVAAAERCNRLFTNFSFRRFDSPKICKVYPAHIQGLQNNVLHLMDRAVSEARSHYPIIMWKGSKLKLGKVIAALDVQRRQTAPASAPGKFTGGRQSLMSSSGDMIWPPAEGLDNVHDAEDLFVGGGGGLEDAGSVEAQLLDPLSRRALMSEQGFCAGQDGGQAPPGLDNGHRGHISLEMEVLETMPRLLSALLEKQQQSTVSMPMSTPGNLLGQGAGTSLPGPLRPGPMNLHSGLNGPQQGQEAVAPPVPSGWDSAPRAEGLPPCVLSAAVIPQHGAAQAPGLPTPPHGSFAGGLMPQPLGSLPEGCSAAFSPNFGVNNSVNNNFKAMGLGSVRGPSVDPDGARTIELRNPDDDVLSKFLGRFG